MHITSDEALIPLLKRLADNSANLNELPAITQELREINGSLKVIAEYMGSVHSVEIVNTVTTEPKRDPEAKFGHGS